MPNYKIVWIKNDQEIFSFNPHTFPEYGNLITDPIINVITENNSFMGDRLVILGGGGRDPLKVKLKNRDTALTYEYYRSKLQELKLDDNLKYLITIENMKTEEVNTLEKNHNFMILSLFILLISVGFLIEYFTRREPSSRTI